MPEPMNSKLFLFFLVIHLLISIGSLQGGTPYEVRGDRVNLRVRPDEHSEMLGQANHGYLLQVLDFDGEWAKVVPPESVEAWVHRDFIEEGVVRVSELNVRGGPGINYQVMGRIERGTRLEEVDRRGDWVRVKPPEGTVAYISRQFIQPVMPEPLVAFGPSTESDPEPKPLPPPLEVRPVTPQTIRDDLSRNDARPPEAPANLDLVPLAGQGKLATYEGILVRTGFLFGRPADFRLVKNDGQYNNTLCYVHGNKAQMKSFLRNFVQITGREYWYEGGRLPVIVPERIGARKIGEPGL